MFGSLLASYVLGFIAFMVLVSQPPGGRLLSPPASGSTVLNERGVVGNGASTASGKPLARSQPDAAQKPAPAGYVQLLTLLPYAFYILISLSFTYLTVSMYVSYHVGILTMPHTPLGRLALDFMVSLLPAFCFGLAMLVPRVYMSLVAIVLLAVSIRQAFETKKLREYFEKVFRPERAPVTKQRGSKPRELDKEERKAERDEKKERQKRLLTIRYLISKYDALSGWKPLSPWASTGLGVFCLIAILADYGILYFWRYGEFAHKVMQYICALVICTWGHRTLRRRSAVLAGLVNRSEGGEIGELDKAAIELERDLATQIYEP